MMHEVNCDSYRSGQIQFLIVGEGIFVHSSHWHCSCMLIMCHILFIQLTLEISVTPRSIQFTAKIMELCFKATI
jgi:hypothetical protein